jgi:hypothetical protein
MSVGMASFERRGEELDAVDIARRAGQLIWDARYRVWPYLILVAAVTAAVRWLGWTYGLPGGADGMSYQVHDGETLGDFARHGAWLAGRSLAAGLAAGMLLRALLGAAQPWRPDRALLGFAAIYLGAALIPLGLFLPTVVAWQGGGIVAIPFVVATALGGVCGLVAFAWFALRLVIWPVGVAAGDPAMTASLAWQAMLGARVAWLFAGILLVLPLVFGAALAAGIVAGISGRHIWDAGPWQGPLHALIVLLWQGAAAAVYRKRAGLEG